MIIDKSTIKVCRDCKGEGSIPGTDSDGNGNFYTKWRCETCKGTGKYKEEHYIVLANGIAIDSDFAGK